jgi:hypothetical protein
VIGNFEAQFAVTACQVILSNTMGNSSTTGNTSSGHRSADVLQDYGPLPTLLSSNARNVHLVPGKHSVLPGCSVSKSLAASKGSAPVPAQTIALESTTADSAEKKDQEEQAEADTKMKGIVDGARVDYCFKSYREWVPANIGDVRPHGSDPNRVRLAREQVKKGYDKQAKFNTSLSGRTLAICSRAAGGIEQANAEQSSSEALESKDAHDHYTKFLHSLSENCDVQHQASVKAWRMIGNWSSALCSSSEALESKDAHDHYTKFLHSLSENCDAQHQASVKAWRMIGNWSSAICSSAIAQ